MHLPALFVAAAISPSAVASDSSPHTSTVHLECPKTGMLGAVLAMGRRTEALIDFEEVPRAVEGAGWVWVPVKPRLGGGRLKRWSTRPLVATFPADATPEGAMRTIVEQWNASAGVDAHYRVVTFEDRVDVVPFEVLKEDGAYRPYSSVLDMTIQLPTRTGEPADLFRVILEEWEVAAAVAIAHPATYLEGVSIEFGSPEMNALNSVESHPEDWEDGRRIRPPRGTREVTLVSDRASARTLLHDLLDKSLPAGRVLLIGHQPDIAGWSVNYPFQVPTTDGSFGCTFTE
ncbi:MAG: hypothetical protein H6738_20940 [Alphaproteobacteria bacterium]|nr:hypothetical protein [Alphaproteobacteria bacterium]MCB9699260.1 hypothetical protein [Alphaproteobacteria bacterium]